MYLTIGGKIKPQKMYNYSRKMFTRRANPIRIIGYPVNQHPDKQSCAVGVVCFRFEEVGPVCRVNQNLFKFLQIISII
jgi:hypothetical protein